MNKTINLSSEDFKYPSSDERKSIPAAARFHLVVYKTMR